MTILDIEHPRAKGAQAFLARKQLNIRLSFYLENAPPIKALPTEGRGNEEKMTPTMLVVEFRKNNEGNWDLGVLRVYGHLVSDPDYPTVNIYRPEALYHTYHVPAWIRDAVLSIKP